MKITAIIKNIHGCCKINSLWQLDALNLALTCLQSPLFKMGIKQPYMPYIHFCAVFFVLKKLAQKFQHNFVWLFYF